ncbi:MAG: transposase [Okeania sp. SIO2C2]|nr:transposase [Okeania sp. SIO2C2]
MVNGILWILRTGAPWRDLPERYGKWQSVATRYCKREGKEEGRRKREEGGRLLGKKKT